MYLYMGNEQLGNASSPPSGGEWQFLNKAFPAMNQEMRGEAAREQSAHKRIGSYVNKLADRILDPEQKRGDDWHRRFNEKYYGMVQQATVIKPENLERAAKDELRLEQHIGYDLGHGRLGITPEAVEQKSAEILSNQKESLRQWYDYLTSRDSSDVAFDPWFRYYAFRGATTLGKLDKETGKFQKREQNTAAPFPEVNREALSLMYDILKPGINPQNGKLDQSKIPADCSDALKAAAVSGSFGNFYAAAAAELGKNTEVAQTFEGEWRKYAQSRNEADVKALYDGIHGKNTGW